LREGLHGRIPGLLIDGLSERVAGESGIIFDPESCINYFIRKGGSAKNLRDERIGIESDGRDQPIKLVGSKRSVFFRGRRRRRALRAALRRVL
jgi:hypothetical protein